MKLINKTQRVYLLLVAVLLLVWSGVFMYAVSYAVRENIDETLHSELLALVSQARGGDSIRPITTRSIVITPVPHAEDKKIAFSDTTLFNAVEHEPFSYRQVQAETVIQGQPYRITMRRSLVEYDDLFEAILMMELVFMVLLIAGLFIINRNILRRVWEPFYHTLAEVARYKIGREDPIEWRETEIDEFQQLNGVLNDMITQIEHEYKSLKQFTENASHEIQTPLSAIINQIEVLLQDESLPRGKWQKLKRIEQSARKLSRLNKALLLLTKIENRQYPDAEAVAISQMLGKLCNEYRELAAVRNITMETEISAEIAAQINPELAEMMLRNLLSNAIKHNVKGGNIKIRLDSERLVIQNTGAKTTQDPRPFFKRFQKGEKSSNSLGLGLSIVSAIAKANDSALEYTLNDDTHTITWVF